MIGPDLARVFTFEVTPSLPEPLRPLQDIAYNLWWTWHPEAVELFVRIDRELWQKSNHNPVAMLGNCPQATLDALAKDEGFLTALGRVQSNLARHRERKPWHARKGEDLTNFTVAYFCAEFGLTECLQIYSGGLGCLAGDHLKSATELGLPLVGVGLLYRHGYFQQYLNADGWQQEYYPDLDFANLPVNPVLDDKGQQVTVKVQLPGREVNIAVWKVNVGRNPLYLLDTNLMENDPADRGITGHLYGGDMELRIKQEIVLGIGGTRALAAMGIEPDVCHMNEGHSAFLALERIRKLIEKFGVTFDEARQAAAAGHVFTTHTPVPAGIDRFPPEMITRYFRDYHPSLKLDLEGLLALGRENVYAKNEFFSMAVLAIRTSDWANGVSKLHGVVSRGMWQNIWPGVPKDEVPIQHVTNGCHARSWLSSDLISLLDRYLGARWQDNPSDHQVWQAINEVPDEELWRVHERRRQRLIVWARRHLIKSLIARGTDPDQARLAAEALTPNALTIGFARRFATYKRGNLFFRDRDRLLKLLTDADRPIQFLIAGKAHPADGGGKDLIRQIVHFARESGSQHKVVFLENYDIMMARYLVQGCDVWLNNPRRGMEASGTSGMKAAINGVLNCSILDGWWDEAYDAGDIGWSIGRGEEYANPDVADDIESRSLYDILEKQIVPTFYDRDQAGLPHKWVAKMKRCISVLAPFFNTNRMVQEYAEKLYFPSLRRSRMLTANKLEKGVVLAHQKDRLRALWGQLEVQSVEAATDKVLGVRDKLAIGANVKLGELTPAEVRVQLYLGKVNNDGQIIDGQVVDLTHEKELGGGVHRFAASITPSTSGRHGFAVRIIPGGEIFQNIVEPGLIFWDNVKTRKPTTVRVATGSAA
ncbi:MAG: alpha-glucan family phosphorylase, partial [Phycisphaeraceae bacterium]|nr:alpha-glucan family phosphorylase [Phycisphaeraceae bacterium]